MAHTQDECEFLKLHPQIVEQVRKEMPAPSEQEQVCELFRMFADPTRLRILTVLRVSDMCVCHIAEILDMTVSAISHQLRLLRAAHLVTSRRVGKSVIYSLADDHVRTILGQGMDHVDE